MLVLGGMHFFNMFNIARMRRKAKAHEAGASKPEVATLAPAEPKLQQV
jgi:hypothetical protein